MITEKNSNKLNNTIVKSNSSAEMNLGLNDILLRILDEKNKSIDSIKNLDWKIVYFSIFSFAACVYWVSSKPAILPNRNTFYTIIIGFSLLSIIFLLRNHLRHHFLRQERYQILKLLFSPEQLKEISSKKFMHELLFHLGRSIYICYILLGTIFCLCAIQDML